MWHAATVAAAADTGLTGDLPASDGRVVLGVLLAIGDGLAPSVAMEAARRRRAVPAGA